MNIEQLTRDQNLVEEYITRIGSDRTNDAVAPIIDGVMDPESYFKAGIKIAWVLKEPYDDFDDNWVETQALFRLLPQEPQASMAKMPVHIEEEDENNYYFLLINDFIKEQNIAPLDYVRDEIALILKNKKKLAFENELERQINEEGIQKKYVKIY